jgi:hypothetical protein
VGSRISVVGNSGSGKSTFAAALADRLGLRHIELDGIYHQPGWQALSVGAFRHRVRQALGAGDWVVDGNYSSVVPAVVWPRADTVVWLDFSRSVVATRIVSRTVRRARSGELICNGNTEAWSNLWRRGGVIRWSLGHHGTYRARFAAAASDPRWAHARFTRVASPAAADAFLASLTATGGAYASGRQNT